MLRGMACFWKLTCFWKPCVPAYNTKAAQNSTTANTVDLTATGDLSCGIRLPRWNRSLLWPVL